MKLGIKTDMIYWKAANKSPARKSLAIIRNVPPKSKFMVACSGISLTRLKIHPKRKQAATNVRMEISMAIATTENLEK